MTDLFYVWDEQGRVHEEVSQYQRCRRDNYQSKSLIKKQSISIRGSAPDRGVF